jgi:DNA ligase (NAD+)
MPGFGEKSVQNILNAISVAKQTTLSSFLSAIGIPLVGRTIAQEIENNGITTYAEFRDRVDQNFNFMAFNGFGPEITSAILHYDYSMADEVVDFLSFSSVDKSKTESIESKLSGMTFVVTGSLKKFKNREEIKEFIEKNGGKMTTAISAKTTALINNDVNSTSSKNLKAKKLNIPIYSEDEFISVYSLNL